MGFSHASASETETNAGSFRAGIPSLGGPPERILLYGTLCLVKSVLNSYSARAGGGSSGDNVGITGFWGDGGTFVGTEVLAAGASLAGIGPQALNSSNRINANTPEIFMPE